MRYAIPTAKGLLCMHFGHCEVFTVIDNNEGTRVIEKAENLTPPPHQPGLFPKWLAEQKVDIVIAGGMGGRAFDLFQQVGIKVVTGAPASKPEDLVQTYVEGKLQTGNNVCDH